MTTISAIHAVVELAASQHSVITRRQAAALEPRLLDRVATATRSRAGSSSRIPACCAFSGAPPTYERELMAAVLAAGGHARRVASIGGSPAPTRRLRRARRRSKSASTAHIRWSSDRLGVRRWPTTSSRSTTCDRRCRSTESRPPTWLARSPTSGRSFAIGGSSGARSPTPAGGVQPASGSEQTAERLHRPGQRGTGVLLRHLDSIPFEGRVPDSWFEELVAACLADRAHSRGRAAVRDPRRGGAIRRPGRPRHSVRRARARGAQPAVPLRPAGRVARRAARRAGGGLRVGAALPRLAQHQAAAEVVRRRRRGRRGRPRPPCS